MIRDLYQYNYKGPVITVSSHYLALKSLNWKLRFNEKLIKTDEIKSIGTDLKMEGDKVVSESLSLKMLNSETHLFPLDFFDISHHDIYNKIKELNPQAKLLNTGEFAYED